MGDDRLEEGTTAMRSRTTLARLVVCAVLAAGLAACRSQRIDARINSLGHDSPSEHPRFFMIPGVKDVDRNDLQFREYAEYMTRALVDRGFAPTEDLDAAEAVIVLTYGISDPKTFSYTYSTPVWGQTGVSSATTTGMATTYGPTTLYSGRTTYTPTYGVVGSSTHVATQVFFVRYFGLESFDQRAYRERSEIVPIWKTVVTSVGPTGDLRAVMPALVTVAAPYFAAATENTVNATISLSDDRINQLRAPRSAQATPVAQPQP